MSAAPLTIAEGHQPGALGRLVEMHGTYYAREWEFGVFFEAKVAAESAAFFQRYDPTTDRAWFVLQGERTVGSLIIDGGAPEAAEQGAHLRWFILDDACRGQGVGQELMRAAVGFCDARGFRRLYLTTFAGLDAARALYERHGFRLIREQHDRTWGTEVSEQLFARSAPVSGGTR